MKTTVLSVLGCALLAAGVIQARAQTTNVTLNVNIALTGVAQSNETTVTRVKVGTKDVINAIASANGTNFSVRAKLLAIAGGGGPSFIIRDGATEFPVPDGTLTVSSVLSVGTTRTNATGLITGSSTSIDRFVLTTPTLNFDVQGYTTESDTNRGRGRDILENTSPVSLSSKVNGFGARAGGAPDTVLQGVISASGRKIEIIL